MEKFGSMVYYVINEPLREFNLRMQVRLYSSLIGVVSSESECMVQRLQGEWVKLTMFPRVYTFRWRWLFAGLAGINGRSSVLDPFRSAFRVVLGCSERGVYARSDE